jgi:hypothetical protein
MTQKITWDASGKRFYETGLDHGVLYPIDSALGTYPKGYAWNGLISVSEKPSGAEANAQYADNTKYLNLISLEEFSASIEAFTYPAEFGVCDGSVEPLPGLVFGQQDRKQFGLAYRTVMGNDISGNSLGYKLHLVYGCLAAPSEKAYKTINDSPEPITFSWEITTTPVAVASYKPVSILTIDSTTVDEINLAALEAILYGATPSTEGRLPLPAEVITLLT